jgi:hypothetical protein
MKRKFICSKEDVVRFVFSERRKELFIEEFYTDFSEEREVRFRRISESGKFNKYYLTEKTGTGSSRTKVEKRTDRIDYENHIIGNSIVLNKIRYIIDLETKIDFYPNGLRILVKEYDSEEDAKNDKIDFPFIIKEVTGEREYSEAQIAKNIQKKDF